MSGAFASAALDLHSRGIAVIPTGGDDGKKPLVKGWGDWKGQSRPSVESFARKFSDANIGIITGLSRLTVVDADDAETLAQCESVFGKSPLVVRSPRGGGHLYFRSNGERNANLRSQGLNADIRGDGGMLLAPPSVRRCVGEYRIERGSWSDLDNLPCIQPRSTPSANDENSAVNSEVKVSTGANVRAIEGERNSKLFDSLRYYVEYCDSLDDLLQQARAVNDEFSPPLPSVEVSRCARSVWRMKIENRLIKPGQQRIISSPDELDRLGADAFYLLAFLRRWHGAKNGEPFALATKAMVAAGSLPGWGRNRLRTAIRSLLGSRDLIKVRAGGSRKGDSAFFRLNCFHGVNYRGRQAERVSSYIGSGSRPLELAVIDGGKP